MAMLLKPFKTQPGRPSRESGVALVASLFILVLVTVLGISTMQSSNLQLRMANVVQTRQELFNAAETTLVDVENAIESIPYMLDDFQTDLTGSYNFDAACTDGRCFFGTYTSAHTMVECDAGGAAPAAQPAWKDTTLDVWNDASKHDTLTVVGLDNPVKYIVEFLCFMPRSEADRQFFCMGPSPCTPDDGAILFRITALAVDDFDRSQVMLQSTYKKLP